jgi:pSer/pThr/pTyr-binding forkhead associated (FHA) protein
LDTILVLIEMCEGGKQCTAEPTATSIAAETVSGLWKMQAVEGGGFAIVQDLVNLGHGLTVGRQATPGQVVVNHPNISRGHAAFEVVDGTVVQRDLGGTNGTYVIANACVVLVAWSRVTVLISAHFNRARQF